MKKILLTILLLSIMTYPLMAKKVAFLIGVGNVATTLNTDKDIERIKTMLGKDFRSENIIELQNQEATYENIKEAFESLYSLDKDDTLFFYYTGHGSRFYHGSEEDDNLDEFLVLYGMKFKGNEVSGGVMIDDELNYHFSKIKAKKVIVFDCCHSETMKKSLGSKVKSWQPKGGAILYRTFDVNPNYAKAINSNFINLSASGDEEQSEDSDNGGIFTLTLQKVLKEQGDISFSELIVALQNNLLDVAIKNGQSGDFTPHIDSDNMNPKTFRTKDIFAVASKPKPSSNKETLEHYLNSKLGAVSVKIGGNTKAFPLDDSIEVSSHLAEEKGDLYLLELKEDDYRLVAKMNLSTCKNNGNKKQCVFNNLISQPPYGETKIYLIYTKNPLDIPKSKTKAFAESLKSQLQSQEFKVGREVFETVR